MRKAINSKKDPIEDSLSMRSITWFAQRYHLLGWHKAFYYFINEFKPEYREAMALIATTLLGAAFTPSINDFDSEAPHYIPNQKQDLITAGFLAA